MSRERHTTLVEQFSQYNESNDSEIWCQLKAMNVHLVSGPGDNATPFWDEIILYIALYMKQNMVWFAYYTQVVRNIASEANIPKYEIWSSWGQENDVNEPDCFLDELTVRYAQVSVLLLYLLNSNCNTM